MHQSSDSTRLKLLDDALGGHGSQQGGAVWAEIQLIPYVDVTVYFGDIQQQLYTDKFDTQLVEQEAGYSSTHLPTAKQQHPDLVVPGNGPFDPHRATPDAFERIGIYCRLLLSIARIAFTGLRKLSEDPFGAICLLPGKGG